MSKTLSPIPSRRLIVYKDAYTEIRLSYECTCEKCPRTTTGGKLCSVHNAIRRSGSSKALTRTKR